MARMRSIDGTEQFVENLADSTGALITVDFSESGAQTLVYDGDVLQYIQVVNAYGTYRQTYTYTGALLTGVSEWVKQP